MAKFVFQLESVLRARKAEERARQLALAAVQRDQALLEDELRRIHATIQSERDQLRSDLVGANVDLRAARMQAAAAFRLEAKAQRIVQGIAALQPRLEAARLALVDAVTKRKAVEKLREARYAEWLFETKKREAAILDEVGIMASARAEREAADEARHTQSTEQHTPAQYATDTNSEAA